MFLLITIVAKRAGRVPVGFSDSAASSGSLCAHSLQGIARTLMYTHPRMRTHTQSHTITHRHTNTLLFYCIKWPPLHALTHTYTCARTHAHSIDTLLFYCIKWPPMRHSRNALGFRTHVRNHLSSKTVVKNGSK